MERQTMSFLLSSENTPRYLLDSNLITKERLENLQVNAGGHGKKHDYRQTKLFDQSIQLLRFHFKKSLLFSLRLY